MPKDLFTGSYTAEGAKGVLKEGGTGRRAATEKLIASLGGTLEAYYFAFGSDDFYLIADLPGNAAAASLRGALRGRTVRGYRAAGPDLLVPGPGGRTFAPGLPDAVAQWVPRPQ